MTPAERMLLLLVADALLYAPHLLTLPYETVTSIRAAREALDAEAVAEYRRAAPTLALHGAGAIGRALEAAEATTAASGDPRGSSDNAA